MAPGGGRMTALYIVNGVAYGNLLFLMAAGFTLIFGVLRVINMAHGSLYLLGAHVCISVAQHGGGLVLAIACGALSTALLGPSPSAAAVSVFRGIISPRFWSRSGCS